MRRRERRMSGVSLCMQRLSDGEVEQKEAASIRQYRMKPTMAVKNTATLRHMDQQDWLRCHGKIPARCLTSDQRAEIRECFNLLDANRSGCLDVDELQTAFRVLGIAMTRSANVRLFQAYSGGGDEVNLRAFEKIMAASREGAADEDAGARRNRSAMSCVLGGETGGAALPFHQMAAAFRRKKLLALFMHGGHARQEIMDTVDKEKRNEATNLLLLPPLSTRMNDATPGDKVVSRYFMLDKLGEIGGETWAGTSARGLLPSQAIHQALGRNLTWDQTEQRVSKEKAAGKVSSAPNPPCLMGMYKLSAEDRQYAQAIEAKARAAEGVSRREGSEGEEGEEEAERGGGGGNSLQLHSNSSHSIPSLPRLPSLPPLAEEFGWGDLSSASTRGRRSGGGGNGFVLARCRKAYQGATGTQSELAKKKKGRHARSFVRDNQGFIIELCNLSSRNDTDTVGDRRREQGGGQRTGATYGGRGARVLLPSRVSRDPAWPGGGTGGGGGGVSGESAMVATVARDRAQFGRGTALDFAGASSHQMPGMS